MFFVLRSSRSPFISDAGPWLMSGICPPLPPDIDLCFLRFRIATPAAAAALCSAENSHNILQLFRLTKVDAMYAGALTANVITQKRVRHGLAVRWALMVRKSRMLSIRLYTGFLTFAPTHWLTDWRPWQLSAVIDKEAAGWSWSRALLDSLCVIFAPFSATEMSLSSHILAMLMSFWRVRWV